MRRRLALTLAALACVLAHAGCQTSGTNTNSGARAGSAGGAEALVTSLNSFTDELLTRIEKAQETKAGVAEAQALLDARKNDFAGRVAALKQGARDAGEKAKLLEAEVDNTDRVRRLQLRYADAVARDPELKAALERLIEDYDALFR
jgi:hypothetical protein